MPHDEVAKIQRARAKQLRRTMTRAETLLWRHLKVHRLAALGFRRQSPMGSYISDFVCIPASSSLRSTAKVTISNPVFATTAGAMNGLRPADIAFSGSPMMM
jgi:hypothetical protein